MMLSELMCEQIAESKQIWVHDKVMFVVINPLNQRGLNRSTWEYLQSLGSD